MPSYNSEGFIFLRTNMNRVEVEARLIDLAQQKKAKLEQINQCQADFNAIEGAHQEAAFWLSKLIQKEEAAKLAALENGHQYDNGAVHDHCVNDGPVEDKDLLGEVA